MSLEIPVRLYKLADSKMLQFARTYLALFVQDRAAFIALNPEFDNNFADQWQNAIQLAYNTETDEVFVDQQVEQTEQVKLSMEQCRRKYRQVMYFATETFGEKSAVLNEFGRDDYNNIREDQAAMVLFMGTLGRTADKYFERLRIKGFTQQMLNEITALQTALSDNDTSQEVKKKERGTAAGERIGRMNEVWKNYVQKVNRASKIVFDGNYPKLHQYLLPGSENRQEDVILTGNITDQATAQPIEGATATIQGLGIAAVADEFGVYAFAQQIPDGSYALLVQAAGYQDHAVNISLVNGSTLVQNVALIAN